MVNLRLITSLHSTSRGHTELTWTLKTCESLEKQRFLTVGLLLVVLIILTLPEASSLGSLSQYCIQLLLCFQCLRFCMWPFEVDCPGLRESIEISSRSIGYILFINSYLYLKERKTHYHSKKNKKLIKTTYKHQNEMSELLICRISNFIGVHPLILKKNMVTGDWE